MAPRLLPRQTHRALVAAVVFAATAIVVLQIRALLAVEDPWWSGGVVDPWTPMAFSLYASGLAAFLAWRAGDGPGTRAATLALATMGVWLSLVVVPGGGRPGAAHGVAYAASWIGFFWFLRFAMLFPREITAADLAGRPGGSGRPWGPGAWMRGLQRLLVKRPWVLWAAAFVILGLLARGMVGPRASRAYLLPPTRTTDLVHLAAAPIALLIIGLGTAFLRTSYRVADEEGRRKLRWLVLSSVALLAWAGFGVALAALSLSVDLSGFQPLIRPFWMAYYPVAWFLIFTGIAASIFHSGAFDVRPLIDRTTVYGAMVVLLTFLFVGVEEAVEAQLVRLGVREGTGTWLGAGVIALAVGPLKARLERLVAEMGREEEGEDAGTGDARGAPVPTSEPA